MAFDTAKLGSLMRDPDYLRIWLIGLMSGICRFLEMLVVGIFAFELTGSPFLVAVLVILRLLPLVLFGSVIGTLADRSPPRSFLFGGMIAATLIALGLFLTLVFDVAGYWAVAAAGFGLGVVRTMDMPLRRRIQGDVAGPDRLVAAISFDSATNNSTRMIGPLTGGLFYQWLGPEGAFLLMAALYGISAFLVAGVRSGGAREAGGESPRMLQDLVEGLSYALQNRDVRYILLTTIVFNVCGVPFLAMIPVLGTDELQLSAGWVGVLAAMEGAGAFLFALFLSLTMAPFNHRRVFYFGVVIYVCFSFTSGWLTYAVPMAIAIFCVGLGSAGFGAMQSTLIYMIAPPHMRSRLFGLVTICIGTGLVGVFNIGLMAEWYGTPAAVRIVAVEGMIGLFLIGLGWSELWRRGN